MTKETMIAMCKLMEMFDTQRETVENDAKECLERHEHYTLDEQRYDEGYANALLWASLTIGKMLFGLEKE